MTTMETVKSAQMIEALIQLVELCEKETHQLSGTIMFSNQKYEYIRAKELVDKLKKNQYKL